MDGQEKPVSMTPEHVQNKTYKCSYVNIWVNHVHGLKTHKFFLPTQ